MIMILKIILPALIESQLQDQVTKSVQISDHLEHESSIIDTKPDHT